MGYPWTQSTSTQRKNRQSMMEAIALVHPSERLPRRMLAYYMFAFPLPLPHKDLQTGDWTLIYGLETFCFDERSILVRW
jgi:hypothetical protein